jgi:hypothetical protein
MARLQPHGRPGSYWFWYGPPLMPAPAKQAADPPRRQMNRSIRWLAIARANAFRLFLPTTWLAVLMLAIILAACGNQPGASGAPGASGPGY